MHLAAFAALVFILLSSTAEPVAHPVDSGCFGDAAAPLTAWVVTEAGDARSEPAQAASALRERFEAGEAELPAGVRLCIPAEPVTPDAMPGLGAGGADAAHGEAPALVVVLRCCYDAVASNDADGAGVLADAYRNAGRYGYFYDARSWPPERDVLALLEDAGVPALGVDLGSDGDAEIERCVAGLIAALQALAGGAAAAEVTGA